MKKTKILAGLLVVFMSMSSIAIPLSDIFTISVSAANESTKSDVKNGWYNSNGKKLYYSDGKKVVSKTKKIDGKIYLFDDNGYLLTGGMHTVNNNKYYSDNNGVVKCNQWVGHKYNKSETIYWYAESTGKVTKYSFKPEKTFSYSLFSYYNLYINDELATKSDLKKVNKKETIVYDGLYRFGSDYYYIWSYSSDLLRVMCSGTANLIDIISSSYYIYDFGSGKYLGEGYGILKTNSKGMCSGQLFNAYDGCIYNIKNQGEQTTKYKAGALVILESNTKVNSVGGIEPSLYVINNSSKTIKYIHYKVYVINGVGDIVRCDITNKSSFNLLDTGPYKPGELSLGGWDPIMYNYSGREVIISSVTIDYTDGTSVSLNGNQITKLA